VAAKVIALTTERTTIRVAKVVRSVHASTAQNVLTLLIRAKDSVLQVSTAIRRKVVTSNVADISSVADISQEAGISSRVDISRTAISNETDIIVKVRVAKMATSSVAEAISQEAEATSSAAEAISSVVAATSSVAEATSREAVAISREVAAISREAATSNVHEPPTTIRMRSIT